MCRQKNAYRGADNSTTQRLLHMYSSKVIVLPVRSKCEEDRPTSIMKELQL